jgi:hypothetical protein
MNVQRRSVAALVGLIVWSLASGCASHTDRTQTLEVQRSGVLGRWYQLPRDAELVKGGWSGLLVFADPDDPAWHGQKRLGKVYAGTKIVSCRELRVSELVAFMILPVYWKHDCVMGMIVEGPQAGKEVNLSDPFGARLAPISRPTSTTSRSF